MNTGTFFWLGAVRLLRLPGVRLLFLFVCFVVCFGFGSIGGALVAADESQEVEKQTGREAYATHCGSCHGDRGQGSDQYGESLTGDSPLDDLASYIEETMPEEDPSQCMGEDAKRVAKYIFDEFYSPAAQKKLSTARIELSRLTVRQYQESVADLMVSFGDPIWIPEKRGLKAYYFASRNWTDNRQLAEQIDPSIDFAEEVPHFDAEGKYPQLKSHKELSEEKSDELMNEGFSVYWSGAVLAPETGMYSITVESINGFQLWMNDLETPLIDKRVSSSDESTHTAKLFMLGGRPYSVKLELFSYTDPPAKIRLLWKPPSGSETVIPASALVPFTTEPSLAVSTAFPADDSSAGYARGVDVSQQWDESTTLAAIETANWVTDNLEHLAKTKETQKGYLDKIKVFCREFVETAFVRLLNEEEVRFFVTQHFDNELSVKEQVKRVVILALKSPRFLFPELETRSASETIARRLSLVIWDSLPDQALSELARKGELTNPEVLEGQLYRMIENPRSKSKLHSFFDYWLKTDKAVDATKDESLYPNFNSQLLGDMRRSLELYLDDVVWNEESDFRELFLADYLFANQRLAAFYGLEADSPGFSKIQVDEGRRAGVLTHPYLMTGLAYHKDSSPIHRGVFIARKLLGRDLKQPPDNVEPLTEEFDPTMTTRQRVEHQTKDTACMHCHSVINPLGFSLENYDAVGRFRVAEKDKTINVDTDYKTPSGRTVPLSGAQDLANFLAENTNVQQSFVSQLFRHYVKQPIDAYGSDRQLKLHEKFVEHEFSIRQLLVEIARATVDRQENENE